MCHSGFVGHKLPGRPPRARIAAETLAPGDPRHLVPDSRNRGAQRPGFRAAAPATAKTHKHHEQVRRPALGRSFLSLLFAGDDDRRLGRATTIDLEAVLAVSRRTWPQHLAAYH